MRKNTKKITENGFLRRFKTMFVSSHVWRERFAFWCGAIILGIVSIIFAHSADWVQSLFHTLFGKDSGLSGANGYLWCLILTPLGFIICTYVGNKYFIGTNGSGIQQAIVARRLKDNGASQKLLSLKFAIGKVFLTLIGLFTGASIGREGPTVQIGAAIMLMVSKQGQMARASGLILAGSAAGIAAAFNSPIAGIVFSIEEMAKSYAERVNGLVIWAVVVSGMASFVILGQYSYFGKRAETVTTTSDWVLTIVCGVLGGLFGAFFSYLGLKMMRWLRKTFNMTKMRNLLTVTIIAGLITAIIGILFHGETFGSGYEQAKMAVAGESLSPFYFIGKFVVGVSALVSGIPGGIFAPSLAVGAGFGTSLAVIFGVSAGVGAIVGMSGYFAGVTQSPMTTFVIMLEMTANYDNVMPIMVASIIGFSVARLISNETLYYALARDFMVDFAKREKANKAKVTS